LVIDLTAKLGRDDNRGSSASERTSKKLLAFGLAVSVRRIKERDPSIGRGIDDFGRCRGIEALSKIIAAEADD
jgi:hypothetical protein